MPEFLFEEELERLRSIERQFISQSPSRFSSTTNEKVFRSLKPLKESIVRLRDYEGDETASVQPRFLRLKEELPEVVGRFIHTLSNSRSDAIMNVVLEETLQFIENVKNLDEESHTQRTDHSAELEAMLSRTQRSLLENESELKQLREATAVNHERADRAEEAAKNAQNLAKRAEAAATKLATSQIADEWSDEYSKYIEPDTNFIKQIDGVRARLEEELDHARFFMKRGAIRFGYWLRIQWIDKGRGGAFYSGHSYVNTSRRWRFWRSFYFIMILASAGLYVFYVATHRLPSQDELLHYAIEKAMFAPIVVVFSIGFIFASRNYRIAANRLEDYRHNFIVARTLQNLMKLPEAKDGNLLNMLLEKGVGTLFAHRPSGYMNKASSEDSLIQSLMEKIPSGNSNRQG